MNRALYKYVPKIKQSITWGITSRPNKLIKRENKLYKLDTVNSEANFNVELENSNIIPQKINRETTQNHRKNIQRFEEIQLPWDNSSSSGTKSKHRVESIRSLNTSIQSKKEFLYKYMNKYKGKYAMNKQITKQIIWTKLLK